MKLTLTEKHLFLIATEVHGISEIEFKNKGRWDVPNEISYSRLQVALDALARGVPTGPLPERCEDCWYYVPEEWWEEPTDVGYPPMPMCEPPTCTGWSVPYGESRFVHTVPPDGYCHRWEPRYQVKPPERLPDESGEVPF